MAIVPAARPLPTGPDAAPSPAPPPRWPYRLRGVLIALPAALALVFAPPREPTEAAFWGGVALVLAGWGVRIWAQVHLGYRLRRRMALVACGPFRLCRNPIYLANAIICIGIVMAAGAPLAWSAAASAWCALVFPVVVAVEEHRLRRSYGRAYRRYCAVVPRWIPRRPPALARCAHRLTTDALVAEVAVPLVLLPVLVRLLLLD